MTLMFYDSIPQEQQVTSINWTQVASKTGILHADREYLIWVSAEYAGSSLSKDVGIRVLVDGVEVSFDYHKPTLINQYKKFCDFGLFRPTTEGDHTISMEVRALSSGVTLIVRRIRLAVMQE